MESGGWLSREEGGRSERCASSRLVEKISCLGKTKLFIGFEDLGFPQK